MNKVCQHVITMTHRSTGQTYLLLDIVEGVWGVNGETDKDDVRIGIRKRAKSVVIFLARSIP